MFKRAGIRSPAQQYVQGADGSKQLILLLAVPNRIDSLDRISGWKKYQHLMHQPRSPEEEPFGLRIFFGR